MTMEEQTPIPSNATSSNETTDQISNTYIQITGDNAIYPIIGDNNTIIMTFFSIAASISSITQVILMIVDMRLRHNKKKTLSTTVGSDQRELDKIKSIRVQMSDGSWVQIDSWLDDPQKIKEFLDIYHSPSASPKPLQVVFILENGTRLPVTLSDNVESEQELDALINYLKLGTSFA